MAKSEASSEDIAASQGPGERFWSELRGYAEALLIAFLIVTFAFNTVGVVGDSMRPNLDGGVGGDNLFRSLLTGDRVFIPKYETWLRRLGVLGDYARGDIVVVREPANSPHAQLPARCFVLAELLYDCRPFFIKRVIAGPGDRLYIEDGQVVVNGVSIDQSFVTASGEIRPEALDFPVVTQHGGEVDGFSVGFAEVGEAVLPRQLPQSSYYPAALPLEDPYVELYYGSTVAALSPVPADAPAGAPFILELIIPEDHYFVMGDNRSEGGSEDSKYFGPIPERAVAGRAAAILWPPQRGGRWNWGPLRPPDAFGAVPPPRE